MATLMKRGSVWYGCWWDNGKQMWKSLSTDKGMAQIKLAEITKNLAADKDGSSLKEIRWDEFVEKYAGYSKTNKAKSTVVREMVVFRNFNAAISIEKLSQLTPEILEEYKQIRHEAGLGPGTINREIITLKSAVKKAEEWSYNAPSVTSVRRLQEPKKRPMFFTKEDLDKMIAAAEPFWKCVIYLGFYAGLRRGEMLSLGWDHVDFSRHQLKIYPTEEWTPKDYEAREIQMHPKLEDFLSTWKKLGAANGKVVPWTQPPHFLSITFTRFLTRLDINKGSLHSLRHSFASHMAMAGIDLYRIGRMMGHSEPSTTQIYAHLLPSSLAEAVGKLPEVG